MRRNQIQNRKYQCYSIRTIQKNILNLNYRKIEHLNQTKTLGVLKRSSKKRRSEIRRGKSVESVPLVAALKCNKRSRVHLSCTRRKTHKSAVVEVFVAQNFVKTSH